MGADIAKAGETLQAATGLPLAAVDAAFVAAFGGLCFAGEHSARVGPARASCWLLYISEHGLGVLCCCPETACTHAPHACGCSLPTAARPATLDGINSVLVALVVASFLVSPPRQGACFKQLLRHDGVLSAAWGSGTACAASACLPVS